MRTLRVCLLALGVSLAAQASAADSYVIDPVHSSVQWKVQHMGAGHVWGRFTDFSGTLRLDGSAPEQSAVELTVKSASVLTDNEKRDQHLRSPDFFNARQFPVITFKSSAVKPTGPNSAEVAGELTLKGVTRTVTARATRTGAQGDLVGLEATLTLQRSDFGMGFGVGQGLGDEVQLLISVEAKRQ
jgi:polyisoprenoid-binding protein YceI